MAALAGGAGPLVPAFNGFDFGAPKLAQKLRDFSVAWDEIRRNAGEPSSPNFYPNLDDDPLLTPDAPEDREALLKRYLIAEDFTLEKSIERLESTLRFRRDWDVIAMHQPGAAKRILTEECNPGCEAYFTDTGYVDKGGAPMLVARLVLCSSDNTHPWRHLRAAVFICERSALKMKHPVQAGAYLVDCSQPVSDAPMEWKASYCCTHGGDGQPRATKANPNRATRGAGKEAAFALDELWNGGVSVTDKPANEINQTLKSSNANAAGSMSGVDSSNVSPSRTPGNPRDVEKLASELIAEHGELQPGLPLLKAAMKILQAHYPEYTERILFANADVKFWLIFKIFSLWANKRTRKKFKFLGTGWKDYAFSTMEDWIDKSQILRNFGGNGKAYEREQIYIDAVARYEADAREGKYGLDQWRRRRLGEMNCAAGDPKMGNENEEKASALC
eukprot:g4773.t1